MECFRTITSVPQSTSQFRSSMSSSVDVGSSTSKRRRKQEEEEEEGQDSSNSSYSDSIESNQTDYQESINIPIKRKRYLSFIKRNLSWMMKIWIMIQTIMIVQMIMVVVQDLSQYRHKIFHPHVTCGVIRFVYFLSVTIKIPTLSLFFFPFFTFKQYFKNPLNNIKQ